MNQLAFVLLFAALILPSGLFKAFGQNVLRPPRGWNSYDSFSWIIDEEEFLDNAQIVSHKLHTFGYEYVVIDFLWYRKDVNGVTLESYGYDNIDEWGRVVPDPKRWPSSRDGKGFKEVAQKVHGMGLKFGIHLMTGISREAVNTNTKILDVTTGLPYEEGGRYWRAGDIGLRNMSCGWMKYGFMSVNTELGAGRAFLRSLYQQYADWGVDFVKLDCVFGEDLDQKQIITVSEILEDLERPFIFSISPGKRVTLAMGENVKNYVDMYRITADDWDTWSDLADHFDVARDFAAAKLIGANGLHGNSWPDLDMLPLGWLTDPGVQQGPHRQCRLTLDEQKTLMTLWSMAKSPLMYGGDLRHIDDTTFNLITNPTLLEIDWYSENNMEFPYVFTGENPDHLLPACSNSSENSFLCITSCNSEKAEGWLVISERNSKRICWSYPIISNGSDCLHKRILRESSSSKWQNYEGLFQLLSLKPKKGCLDSSVAQRQTKSVWLSSLFSKCQQHANQMWMLRADGTLVNPHSGLCATMKPAKDIGVVVGPRSWVATGAKGEIYIAFFNLNSVSTSIYAIIGDLSKVLDSSKFMRKSSCSCYEVWSGKQFGLVEGTLSVNIAAHGCALFVLNCNE